MLKTKGEGGERGGGALRAKPFYASCRFWYFGPRTNRNMHTDARCMHIPFPTEQ